MEEARWKITVRTLPNQSSGDLLHIGKRRSCKVAGSVILLTSGDRDHCDLTQESKYFDEKLNRGMIPTKWWKSKNLSYGRVNVVVRVYTVSMVSTKNRLQMSDARRVEVNLPTGRKCAMPVVSLPCPRGLYSIQPVSVAIHKPEGAV